MSSPGTPAPPRKRARRARLPLPGAAEVGVAVVVMVLAALAVTGYGLPRPTLSVAASLVWVADSQRGHVVQIDPFTGRVEARLRAGQPGDLLEVAQLGSRLAVTNHATGAVMMLDSGTLAVTGKRSGLTGGIRVLLAGSGTYLVELERGVIRWVDGAMLTDAGRSLQIGHPIVDAAAGPDGALWLHTNDGAVRGFQWSPQIGRFMPATTAGRAAFGDSSRSLVVVATGDRITAVNLRERGCAEPWQPAIVRGLVYVSCRRAGRVVVVTTDGQPADPDIDLPGSPQPVRYDGGLLLAAGERAAVVPDAGGVAQPLRLVDPGVAVRELAGAR